MTAQEYLVRCDGFGEITVQATSRALARYLAANAWKIRDRKIMDRLAHVEWVRPDGRAAPCP